jgi:hypothetical protein
MLRKYRLKSLLLVGGHVSVSLGLEHAVGSVPHENGAFATHTDDELLVRRHSNLK